VEKTAKLCSEVLIGSRNLLALVGILPDERFSWSEAWLVDVVVFRRLGLRRAPGWRARIWRRRSAWLFRWLLKLTPHIAPVSGSTTMSHTDELMLDMVAPGTGEAAFSATLPAGRIPATPGWLGTQAWLRFSMGPWC
jgi:hypothetical protein